MIIDNQSPEIIVYAKPLKVYWKDYKEVLSILNHTDYTKKKVSIRREEICMHYHQGRALLKYGFPVSFLSLGEVSQGDGTDFKPVEFSEDKTKDKEIKSKLLAIIKQ